MRNFDGEKVLAIILQEAPWLSNKRGDDGHGHVIYARYTNQGIEDPELKYHMLDAPERTTPESTISEVYSFWIGDPNKRGVIRRMVAESTMGEREVMHQGPWVERDSGNPAQAARVDNKYDHFRSGLSFERHFNSICVEVGYGPRLIDVSGACAGRKSVQFGNDTARREVIESINFHTDDPTLVEVMGAITTAFGKLDVESS